MKFVNDNRTALSTVVSVAAEWLFKDTISSSPPDNPTRKGLPHSLHRQTACPTGFFLFDWSIIVEHVVLVSVVQRSEPFLRTRVSPPPGTPPPALLGRRGALSCAPRKLVQQAPLAVRVSARVTLSVSLPPA